MCDEGREEKEMCSVGGDGKRRMGTDTVARVWRVGKRGKCSQCVDTRERRETGGDIAARACARTEGRGREKMGKESRALCVCGHRRERVGWCGVLLEKGRGVCGEGNPETAVFNHKLQKLKKPLWKAS